MAYVYIFQLLMFVILPLIEKVLKYLGIGFVVYQGFHLVIDYLKGLMIAQFSQVGTPIVMILGLAKVDVAINIYFSAVTARFVLMGITKASDYKRSWSTKGVMTA